jgi:transcriptional regulator with XRE-family HTH domain
LPPCPSIPEFTAWLEQRYERETLAEIAASLGVSVMGIVRWRKGLRRPSKPVLLLAARLMRDGRGLGNQSPLDAG